MTSYKNKPKYYFWLLNDSCNACHGLKSNKYKKIVMKKKQCFDEKNVSHTNLLYNLEIKFDELFYSKVYHKNQVFLFAFS